MATYNGNNGNNILTGGRADDVIQGYGGHDILTGGGGTDIIDGGPGTDFIIGNQGHDFLAGGPDADIIWGGNGQDLIDGGPGDDTIYGGSGNDILFGGPGRDTFVFNSNQPGVDTIMDFEYGDRIDVRGVDGFFDPDEDLDFSYSPIRANSQFGQDVNEIMSLLGIEARFIDGSIWVEPVPAPADFDPARNVAILLNGVVGIDELNSEYFGKDNVFGSAWIVNPDYFA